MSSDKVLGKESLRSLQLSLPLRGSRSHPSRAAEQVVHKVKNRGQIVGQG